jgi:hypothetical protein
LNGANWAAVQIKAVEMEIEQQKREWEEKRQLQRQQEDLERQRAEKDDNEILTYSREDAMNKVNIRSKNKSQVLGKRKAENANHSMKGRESNGTGAVVQNGKSKMKNVLKTPPKKIVTPVRRNLRNSAKVEEVTATTRATSRKSDRSTSIHSVKSSVRSTSESTSRSTADSMSHKTTTTTSLDESDSECSLDVMIDSNDVNDSDSNSIQQQQKDQSQFETSSQDDDTLLNDDSTMTDETTIERASKNFKESTDKVTSSPRTRSRGTVNVNLWTLDESPIEQPKRQKLSTNYKTTLETIQKEEKQLKNDFGVKECKVSVVDIQTKTLKPPDSKLLKPSPKRTTKRLSARNNTTLDSWLQKPQQTTEKLQQNEEVQPAANDIEDDKVPVTRTRRTTIINKTL